MSRTVLIVAGIVLVLVVGVVGYAFFKPPEQASGPLQAVPLTLETPTVAVAQATATTVPPTVAPTATTEVAAVPATEPAPTATTAAEAADIAPNADNASPLIFEIVPAESQARFIINEVLNGAPKTVVGTTSQVAGQLAVDPANPTAARVGTIQVNARDLTTDNEFRNRAIKNRILETDAYELVTFVPTAINGLPEQVTQGEEMTFQIVGDLTIRNVTRPVTFDVTLVPVNDTRLEGKATTTLAYADFEIVIPAARAVSAVEDTVTLQLDFVATPA